PSNTSNRRTLSRSLPPLRRIVSSTSVWETARSTTTATSRFTEGYFGSGVNRLRGGTSSAITETSRTAAQAGRSRPVAAASPGATWPSLASRLPFDSTAAPDPSAQQLSLYGPRLRESIPNARRQDWTDPLLSTYR